MKIMMMMMNEETVNPMHWIEDQKERKKRICTSSIFRGSGFPKLYNEAIMNRHTNTVVLMPSGKSFTFIKSSV